MSHLSVKKKELLSPEAKKLTRRVHGIVVFLLGNLWEAEKELLLLSEATKAHSLASVMALKRVSLIDGRVPKKAIPKTPWKVYLKTERRDSNLAPKKAIA